MVIVAVTPAVNVGNDKVTTPAANVGVTPWSELAETKATPEGSVSLTTTFVASQGPAFVIVTVY